MARTADKLISDIRKEVSSGILKPGDQLEVTALLKDLEFQGHPYEKLYER